ncbi:MAG: DMT family transporter [Candidatus Poseidoniaceae archaeon]|nr:DMT family transporter [Candidatus Poseidoniaceae archaeon]MBL6889776.1 DMT family transporter [Candidatus Poseidoniaceae archaeon]
MNSQRLILWILLSFSIISISSAGAVFQLMEDVPPLLRASWRFQLTALIMAPIFAYQFNAMRTDEEAITKLKSKQTLWILTGSGLSLGLHMGAWVWSLDNTSLSHSLLFVTIHPLIIVFGALMLRKYVPSKQIFGASIGFIGGGITLLGISVESEVTLLGDLAAIVGACAVVGYFIAGRTLRQWMPLFVYILPVTIIAAVFLAIMSLLLEGSTFSMTNQDLSIFGWLSSAWIFYVLYLAIFPGIVGHAGISSVLRWFPPIIVSVAYLFEPLIGSFIGWVLGTTGIPSFWTWAGAIVLMMGTILVIWGDEENKKREVEL